MRKSIIVLSAVLLLVAAYFVKEFLADSKEPPKQNKGKVVKTVFTEIVKNDTLPVIIRESGNLVAKHKIQLFSEAQGLLEVPADDFRVGIRSSKGKVLLQINNDDDFAALQAQKSSFQNLIAGILPDFKLDYPESFPVWVAYLKALDVDLPLADLPEARSEQEKYFIIGKGIYKSFYAIKNLEEALKRYTIKAPFDGVLTEALVTNGSLVRPGQKLGEYISQDVFELFLSVNANLVNSLKIGKKVLLRTADKSNEWTGKAVRINGKIDQASQTVQVFVEVRGKGLREGMYLESFVEAKEIENAYEVSQKLLINNKAVYVYKDSTLQLQEVTPQFFKEKTVLVSGIPDGTMLISKPVPGAFVGMPVKPYQPTKK